MQLRIWRVHQPLCAILLQGSTSQCRTHLGHLSVLVKGWSIESIAWCVRCGSCALLQLLDCLTGNLNKSMTPAKIEQANSPASLTDCKPWPEHTDATGSTITVDCWPQQTNMTLHFLWHLAHVLQRLGFIPKIVSVNSMCSCKHSQQLASDLKVEWASQMK